MFGIKFEVQYIYLKYNEYRPNEKEDPTSESYKSIIS
jgi:hypothetical protein